VAFIREKTTRLNGRTYRYYSLVENRREGKKVRQRVIRYLGRFESKEDALIAAGMKPAYLNRLDDLDHNRRVGLQWEHEAEVELRALKHEITYGIHERVQKAQDEIFREGHALWDAGIPWGECERAVERSEAAAQRETLKWIRSHDVEYDELLSKRAQGHNTAWFALSQAMKLYGRLTKEEQARARNIPIVAEGLAEREIAARKSSL